MRSIIIAILMVTGVFAQDFIPFHEKLTPVWQNKIAKAGISREIEYIDTPGFDVKDGNLPSYFSTFVYDQNGKITFAAQKLQTDENASEYEFKYNEQGNIHEITMNWTDNFGNATKVMYSFTYDEGKLSYVALFNGLESSGGATLQWLYNYGTSGKPEEIVVKYFGSEESGLFTETGKYLFNEQGRIAAFKTDDSKVTYAYDKNGNLTETVNEVGEINIRTANTYDGNGNLIKSSTTGDAAETFDTYTLNANGFPEKKSTLIKMPGVPDETVNYLYYYE